MLYKIIKSAEGISVRVSFTKKTILKNKEENNKLSQLIANYAVDKAVFKFQYLPDYARHLLNDQLEEFVTVGIRFCREVDLPILRPLAKLSEKELVELTMESNRQMLTALYKNDVGTLIESNINSWVKNRIGAEGHQESIIDRSDIIAEDLVLGFYIRRKLFSFFLYGYTQNAVLHMLIAGEVDIYTTQEELISLKVYMAIQNDMAENRVLDN